MDKLEWAKKEVELACKRENPTRKEGEFDYTCACYESALKAFKSLYEDNHSGYSIEFTMGVLNGLIDGKPLSPIEDTDDIWDMPDKRDERMGISYQCKRMSSLFKEIYSDGHVKYRDVDRITCINQYGEDVHIGKLFDLAEEYIGEVKMPYNPYIKPYKLHFTEFLYNNDDEYADKYTIDTMYIDNIICPSGEELNVHRYFKVNDNNALVEIDPEEGQMRLDAYFGRLLRRREEEDEDE